MEAAVPLLTCGRHAPFHAPSAPCKCGALLLLCLLAAPLRARCEAGSQLALLYVVSRHGSRNVLAKSASGLLDAVPVGDVTLLPTGLHQCWAAGQAAFTRYMNASSCALAGAAAGQPDNTCLSPPGSPGAASATGAGYGVVGDPGVTWSNFNVLVTSSATDRALLSARAFLTGAFPLLSAVSATKYLPPNGQQPVPVYSAAGDDRDDVLIRAYAKCPAFDAALQGWYASAAFAAMSAATAAFRSYVGGLSGWGPSVNGNTSLANWYNVWDEFNTFTSTSGAYGDPMPNASAIAPFTAFAAGVPGTALAAVPGATLMAQITWLANWLETSKMASGLAGALLGGPALGDLAARVNATVAFPNATAHPVPRLVALSAHYNVLLGILSALRLDVLLSAADVSSVPFLTLPNVSTGVIPSAAALIAFELHRSSDATRYAVRLVLQNGPAASYIAVPLPCASAAAAALGGAGACSLADFQSLIAPALASAGTPAAWCGACGPFVTDPNGTPLPLPCAAVQLQQLLSQQAPGKSKKNKDGGGSIGGGSIAAIVLGIALGATLVAGAVAVALARGRRGAPACIRGSGADQGHEMADQGGQERLVAGRRSEQLVAVSAGRRT